MSGKCTGPSAVITAALLFSSCNIGNISGTPVPTPSMSLPTPQFAASCGDTLDTSANFAGTWKLGCTVALEDSNGNPISWWFDNLVISGSTFTESVGIANDSACDTAGTQGTMVVTGTYAIGSASSLGGAADINFTVSSVKITPGSSSQATTWNTSVYTSPSGSATGFCGITTWTSGTATDVTGKVDGNSGCDYPVAGTVLNQVFALGNYGGSLMTCNTPINAVIFGTSQTIGYGQASVASLHPGAVLSSDPTAGAYPSGWEAAIFSGP